MTLFASTRSQAPEVSFSEALIRGVAPDNGLYNPINLPHIKLDPNTTFPQCAHTVMSAYDKELEYSLAEYQDNIFKFAPMVHTLEKNMLMLELFHGPTGAFKDFGASFLAYSMSRILQHQKRRAIILTATSGDTGGAVAHAFHDKKNVEVVILYPAGRVSALQKQQITSYPGNIHPVEVQGSFDDCQRLVKTAFQDSTLAKLYLTSANSINIGRLLPQQCYYHYALTTIKEKTGRIFFVVPSGNLGNLTAGLFALKCDVAIDGLIVACNANRVFHRYLQQGKYRPRPSKPTYSNAMDVGTPSNLERLQALFYHNLFLMRAAMPMSASVSNKQTIATIRTIYQKYNYIADPHTATALYVAKKFLRAKIAHSNDTVIVLSTAHPAKFESVIQQALHMSPPIPQSFYPLSDGGEHDTISAHYRDFKHLLSNKFSHLYRGTS